MNRPSRPIALSLTGKFIFALILLCGCYLPARAEIAQPETVDAAPVIVDGNQLFIVRGIMSYPAPERAALVRNRIIAAARDETIPLRKL